MEVPWSGPEEPTSSTLPTRAREALGPLLPWKPIFLNVLTEIPNVSAACRRAGIDRRTASNARETDLDFAAAWTEALATSADALEESIWRRVMLGESDRLAEMLLRAHKPDLYGDRRRVELTGANGGPIRSATEVAETDHEREMLKAAIRRELELRGEPVEG